ncbi:MAG TPA: phage tail protein I [Halomonas sp.]|nr:phage tail protein I [Halomonas sp.]
MANHLLPPNATPQERAVSETLSRTDTINVPIRALWRPNDCPAHLLPWLAWALSVDEWDEQWSEQQKREAIATAVYLHRHKGTKAAVQRAMQAIGHDAHISEWFEYTGRPYTYRLEMASPFVSQADFNRLIRHITTAANARSWLEVITQRHTLSQRLTLATVTQQAQRTTFSLPPPRFHLAESHTYAASAVHSAHVATLGLPAWAIADQQHAIHWRGAYHTARQTSIRLDIQVALTPQPLRHACIHQTATTTTIKEEP